MGLQRLRRHLVVDVLVSRAEPSRGRKPSPFGYEGVAQPHGGDVAVIDGPQRLLQDEFHVEAVGEAEIAPGGDQILMIEDAVARADLPAMGRELRIGWYGRRFSRGELGEGQF